MQDPMTEKRVRKANGEASKNGEIGIPCH